MSSTPTKLNRGPLFGSLLRFANQAITERALVWLEESGHEAIELAHLAATQALWDAPKGLRLTALARAGRITKQSMSALVEHLEKAGYVERVADPDDGRAVRVRLTARGRSFGHAIRAFVRGVEADWSERIGARRVAELRTALELLRRSLFAADRRDNEATYPAPLPPIRPSRLPTRRPSVTTQRTIGPGGARPGVRGQPGREQAPDADRGTHPERQRDKRATGGRDSTPVERIIGRARPGR